MPIYHQDTIVNYSVNKYTANDTWTKPANLSHAYVIVIGGGGGGRGGRRGTSITNRAGGGAYCSGVVIAKFLASELNTTETIVVGAGGSAGAAATADNTNGGNAGNGGVSYVRSSTFLQMAAGGSNLAGSTTINTALNTSAVVGDTSSAGVIVASPLGLTCLGTQAPGNTTRPFHQGGYYNWRSVSSSGGSITSAGAQSNSGTISGWYDRTNTLTGEESGVGQGVNGTTPTSGYTIGTFFNKYFNWFDPADITEEMPRGGIGGGPGDTAGTIAAGSGAVGRGQGAGGGGGGASTNGANSGAGAAGLGGIVIFINVFN